MKAFLIPHPNPSHELIKNSNDHAAMLKRLGDLMIAHPEPGSKQDEELEFLAFLIADDESHTVQIPAFMGS